MMDPGEGDAHARRSRYSADLAAPRSFLFPAAHGGSKIHFGIFPAVEKPGVGSNYRNACRLDGSGCGVA